MIGHFRAGEKLDGKVQRVALLLVREANHTWNYGACRKSGRSALRERGTVQDEQEGDQGRLMHFNKLDVCAIGRQGADSVDLTPKAPPLANYARDRHPARLCVVV
jgi:hypothetical protein